MEELPTLSRKKSTIVQAVGGYINAGISIVQGLLLIPLYLQYIDIKTYGLWLTTGGILSILSLMNLGMGAILIQKVANAYGKQDYENTAAYIVNGIVVYVCICIFLSIIGYFLSFFIPSFFNLKNSEATLIQQCFQIAVISIVLSILNECLRSFSIAMLRPILPIIGMSFAKVVGLCLTVVMLFDGYSLWAIPIGILITECIIFMVSTYSAITLFLKLNVKIKFSLKIIKQYLNTAPLVMMATVGNAISNAAEPLLITIFLNPQITTIYMVNRKVVDIIFNVLSVLIGATIGPFAHLVGNQSKENVAKIVKTLLVTSFALGVVCFATYTGSAQLFIELWVGKTFVLGTPIILFIALASFARAFRGLISQMLYGLGDFLYSSKFILLEGIGSVILAIALINLIGIIAIPIAFVTFSYTVIMLLGLKLQKESGIRLNLQKIVQFLFSGFVIFCICIIIPPLIFNLNSWAGFVMRVVVTVVALSCLFVALNLNDIKESYKRIFN